MASLHTTTRSILSSFLPRLSVPAVSSTSKYTTFLSRQLSHPLLPSIAFPIPAAIHLNVPGLLEGIWESILRAVPKKRTSHMKQRSRRMAGKGLKDVTSLNKCSVCGGVKRAHLLCPFCVHKIQNFWNSSKGRLHLKQTKVKLSELKSEKPKVETLVIQTPKRVIGEEEGKGKGKEVKM